MKEIYTITYPMNRGLNDDREMKLQKEVHEQGL